jgi:hypothetical protein
MTLLIEWGRANRGRMWHMLSPHDGGDDATFCDQTWPMKEVTHGLPPRGGAVCPRCRDVVDELTRAMILATNQSRPPDTSPTPNRQTLDQDAVVH